MNDDVGRELARYVLEHCGRRPSIHRWRTDDDQHAVDVAVVDQWPTDQMVTALTIDLAATPLGLQPAEYELLIVTEREQAGEAEQLVANSGLAQLKGDLPWSPGATFYDALAMVGSERPERNLTAFEPESSELRLQTTLSTGLVVRWLELRPTDHGQVGRT